MANYGTPLDLYNAYRNLNVLPFDSYMQLGLDVHEYRNNSLGGDYSTAAGTQVYNKLLEKVKAYGQKLSSTNYRIYYPLMKRSERKKNPDALVTDYIDVDAGFPLYNVFCGKGSPEYMKVAIKLAIAFGLVEGTVSAIQSFCDKNIGIDCSGFASNYWGFDAKTACNMPAAKMAPANKRVKTLEEVRTGTAIVFKNGKHVAVVDKILQRDQNPGKQIHAVNCMVAESTADKMVEGGPMDGLNYTEYVLLLAGKKTDPTMFHILRPLNKAKAGIYGVDVYLANW